jgi:hypothetical protein
MAARVEAAVACVVKASVHIAAVLSATKVGRLDMQ